MIEVMMSVIWFLYVVLYIKVKNENNFIIELCGYDCIEINSLLKLFIIKDYLFFVLFCCLFRQTRI